MTELIIELIQTPRGFTTIITAFVRLSIDNNNGIINPQVQAPDLIRFVRMKKKKKLRWDADGSLDGIR